MSFSQRVGQTFLSAIPKPTQTRMSVPPSSPTSTRPSTPPATPSATACSASPPTAPTSSLSSNRRGRYHKNAVSEMVCLAFILSFFCFSRTRTRLPKRLCFRGQPTKFESPHFEQSKVHHRLWADPPPVEDEPGCHWALPRGVEWHGVIRISC
jgi:hypothetical protein